MFTTEEKYLSKQVKISREKIPKTPKKKTNEAKIVWTELLGYLSCDEKGSKCQSSLENFRGIFILIYEHGEFEDANSLSLFLKMKRKYVFEKSLDFTNKYKQR